ncbi:MAG: hypothetical protein IJ736_14880 [Firmicutes bacterium]|nr:hypothetical protein [Bacillota bacterium]
MEENKQSLITNIKSVDSTRKFEFITLQELTDFEWDTVYQFGPFTSSFERDKIVGKHLDIKYSYKNETDGDGVLFTLNDKAVCYLGAEDNDVNISLFSSGTYAENYVSYKYEDLKTLYVAGDSCIRIPTDKEMYGFKNENGNFQYSKGTAYYLYGGFGSELEVFTNDMILPRGYLLDFDAEILNFDFFDIEPESYTLTDIQYNNTDIKVMDTKNTEIGFNTAYNDTALEINLYSYEKNFDIIIDGNYCSCESEKQSNGIYHCYKKIEITNAGTHRISFEGEEIYLAGLWCYYNIYERSW